MFHIVLPVFGIMPFSLCIFLCFSHVCLLRRPVEAKPVQTQSISERDLGRARCLLWFGGQLWRQPQSTRVENIFLGFLFLSQPTATKPPANTTRGGQTPHPEGTEDRTPKEAQGDHPAKTGNTKQGTAAHREKGQQNMQTHNKKKKRANSPAPKEREWGDRDHKARDRDTQQPTTQSKKKKRKKHTPTTQPRRAGHSRDPGPARTPTPHTGTGNGGGQAERARNHTRPISRPKPKPNHEHHKQPAKEAQHHKPCPNTPTQDPSQDWQG